MHALEFGGSRGEVNSSLMPKGVEHILIADAFRIRNFREQFVDAERR